jgi:hypothetical protein
MNRRNFFRNGLLLGAAAKLFGCTPAPAAPVPAVACERRLISHTVYHDVYGPITDILVYDDSSPEQIAEWERAVFVNINVSIPERLKQ